MPKAFGFHKSEKLCNHALIERLFSRECDTLFSYPLLLSFYKPDKRLQAPIQVLLVVSKKRVKKAHERNRIKRLLRENYRLNKHLLLENLKNDKDLVLGITYVGEKNITFERLSLGMKNAFMQFIDNSKKLNN